MSAIRTLAIGAILLGPLAGGTADAASLNGFTSFWTIGDSLSDPGNLYAATGGAQPQSPPYYEGRFSNGPVWAETVAKRFQDQGLATGNFAFGGAKALPDPAAQVPGLSTQLGLLAANSAGFLGDRPVVSLWMGANDLMFDGIAKDDARAVGRAAARAVGSAAAALSDFGVRDVMMFTMPDLADAPRYALSPDAAERAEAARGSAAYNRALDRQITKLGKAGINVIEVDTAALFKALIANPTDFGPANATVPCLVPGRPACSAETADLLAFFDPVHPNSVIHSEIAAVALGKIAPIPGPLPVALLLSGLVLLVAVGRRRANAEVQARGEKRSALGA